MAYRRYLQEDYVGELNILRHEKELILKSYIRYSGDRTKMAEALKITTRSLYDRIAAHTLDNMFQCEKAVVLVLEQLEILGKVNIV